MRFKTSHIVIALTLLLTAGCKWPERHGDLIGGIRASEEEYRAEMNGGAAVEENSGNGAGQSGYEYPETYSGTPEDETPEPDYRRMTTEDDAKTTDFDKEETDWDGESAGAAGLEIPARLKNRPDQILKRRGYTASYNRETRLVNWVAWALTAGHTSGPNKRKGVEYHEDEDVPSPRAGKFDYYSSGYDRGHMCPAGDNKWDAEAMRDCFLFTNMCPQDHQLNGGPWNDLEIKCRSWAQKFGCVYIVTGPVLEDGVRHKTIGKNKITVPEAFFKVLLTLQPSPKAIGFIYDNESGKVSMRDCVRSVDEVEEITGIDFFPMLDDDIERKVEKMADLDAWKR